MGTRHFIQTAPTADLMALNAGMYGFAEPGLLTPHSSVKHVWWTDDRVAETVNRRLVVNHIRGQECHFLDKKIIFATLTNDTYLEWILYRAPRLFLTLAEVGCADRIFSLIDDGWQDEDLPVPYRDVDRLDLSIDQDVLLNAHFYETQFTFLLRQIEESEHIQYGPNEHIPMEYVGSIPPAVEIKDWHRIHFPDEWESTFVRRRFDFGEDCQATEIEYLEDIKEYKKFKHEHICDIWASYTSENAGYTLSTFIGEHTLGTFMDHRTPPQYMELTEAERPCLLLEWMHCLTDTVAYLHQCGNYHGAIRPSNILIDDVNCIAFSDIGHLKTFKRDKHVSKRELKDYQAPELLQETSTPKSSVYNPFAQHESVPSWKIITCNLTPKRAASPASTRHNSISTMPPTSPITSSPVSARNFSRHLATPPRKDSAHESDTTPAKSLPPIVPPRPSLSTKPSLSLFPTISPTPSAASLRAASPSVTTPPLSPLSQTFSAPFPDLIPQTTINQPSPQYTPQLADVFSLGCIYLDIITFLVLGKITTLNKFRRSKSTTISSSTASSYAPTLRSGTSTPAPSVFSSTSSVISSYASPSPSSRFSLPSKTRDKRATHFPSDPIKLAAWTDHLALCSQQSGAPYHSTLLELIPLIKQMLAPNPALRPSMSEIRSVVEKILVREANMTGLCCKGREWKMPPPAVESQVQSRRGSKEEHIPRGLAERLCELRKKDVEKGNGEREGEGTRMRTEWRSSDEGERERRAEGKKGVRRMEPRESRKLEELRSQFSEDRKGGGLRIGKWRVRRSWRGPFVKMP
ncbi:Hypothetical protein D9617_38g090710 [Elsinoe fawcettii]|nr:Hypothetical protein D9617_38g090710 [Elsinoe fawcettii]